MQIRPTRDEDYTSHHACVRLTNHASALATPQSDENTSPNVHGSDDGPGTA